jgi:phospholipase/carboxylesterase
LTELVCEVREPAGDPNGALILLHGRATDEHDLYPFLDFLDPDRRLLGLTPGGPFTDQPPGGRHWYAVKEIGYPEPETFAQGYGALTGFLDAKLAEHGIDWPRTVLGGFSQGAVMSYALGLGSGRPKPAGILAMSGFIPTVDGWEPDLESRKELPVMITHGELDPVISVEFGRKARDILTAGGLDVVYNESRMPHTIDPRVIPELVEWVGERVPRKGGSK